MASDGSKVVAQTPEGTRVATPNPAKGSPSAARGSAASKGSYAAALKAKPSDWHLEFYVDDQKLPLELTIYGAIHQHEARKKKAGNVTPPSMIWQNVYTVKFKKVPGPAKSPEREFISFFLSSEIISFTRCQHSTLRRSHNAKSLTTTQHLAPR